MRALRAWFRIRLRAFFQRYETGRGITMCALSNPTTPGPFNFTQITYAAAGLNYSADPTLSQYLIYEQPSNGFTTRTIDISDFAELGYAVNWPFDASAVPLNGLVCIPNGPGPFPLAVFAHGNHNPLEHSTPGYLYLCNLLASHGIIAATIDVNFLNGRNRGENDGRAIVHLEHIKQFLTWNMQPGHALKGKVDATKVLLAGHSRGGEAVSHVSLFNRLVTVQPDPQSPPVPLDGSQGLGPYQFQIRALIAIAPTEGQYVPIGGPMGVADNYFLVHGSRDGDVYNFPGYLTFDRSHPPNLANPTTPASGFKALLWIHGANHNYFNSAWGQESTNTITRPQQEKIAKAYIGALSQALLLGNLDYMELIQDYRVGIQSNWLPNGVTFVSQYQSPQRLYLQHCEEPGSHLMLSAPTTGAVDITNVTAEKKRFNLGHNRHLYQETTGVRVEWSALGKAYVLRFTPSPLNCGLFPFLSLRVAQSFEPQNSSPNDQDFTLQIDDGSSSFSLPISSLQRLAYPGPGVSTEPKTVMQTVRVSVAKLQEAGINTGNLTTITFLFNRTSTGCLYLDDLQLTS